MSRQITPVKFGSVQSSFPDIVFSMAREKDIRFDLNSIFEIITRIGESYGSGISPGSESIIAHSNGGFEKCY